MFDWLSNLAFDRSVLTLCTGTGIVLLTFLAMQWTSWGTENPVAKCVILSVLAHAALLAYAYSLNLVTELPPLAVVSVVPIRIADATELDTPQPRATDAEAPIWEQIPATELNPEFPVTSTPVLETEFHVERESSPVDSAAAPFENFRDGILDAVEALVTGDSVVQETTGIDSLLQPTEISEPWPTNPTAFPSASLQPPLLVEHTVHAQESQESVDSPVVDPTQELLAELLNANELERAETTTTAQQLEQEQTSNIVQSESESQNLAEQIEAITPSDSIDRAMNLAEMIPERGVQASDEVFDTRLAVSPWSEPKRISAQHEFSQRTRQQAASLRPGDQQPLPDLYRHRLNRQMEEVQQRGGNADTEQAVARGLAFLASIQKPDGSWNPRETGGGREQQVLGHNRQGAGAQADTGITGLAILAFLADGNSHLAGPHQDTVRRGLEYLLQRQQRGGSLAGPAQYYAQMYCHSMALLALSEAYAMSGDQRLRPAVIAGVTYSQDTQNRAGGGWRYQPQEAGDMSQFGWQVMALSSASLNGVSLDDPAKRLMDQFLKRHSRGLQGGLAIYRLGEPTSPTMTAEAMFCRYLLGQPPHRLMAEEAASEILGLVPGSSWQGDAGQLTVQECRNLPGRQADNLYFWYYASLALRQTVSDPTLHESPLLHQGWELWNRHLITRLLSLQRSDGAMAGSWDPEACLWGGYGGRVYTTSLAVLCMQVYYRYDVPLTPPDRTALAPWSPTPIGPLPSISRPGAAGSIQDWR